VCECVWQPLLAVPEAATSSRAALGWTQAVEVCIAATQMVPEFGAHSSDAVILADATPGPVSRRLPPSPSTLPFRLAVAPDTPHDERSGRTGRCGGCWWCLWEGRSWASVCAASVRTLRS
jgi:hypothetical protein